MGKQPKTHPVESKESMTAGRAVTVLFENGVQALTNRFVNRAENDAFDALDFAHMVISAERDMHSIFRALDRLNRLSGDQTAIKY